MSLVIAAPEVMAAAATDLAGVGSALGEAHLAAAAPTVALLPAAGDEVSAGIAQLFSRYAAEYHRLARRATEFHAQFVQNLKANAGSYASAEAANVASLHPLPAHAGSPASSVIISYPSDQPGKIINRIGTLAQKLVVGLGNANAKLGQVPLLGLYLQFLFDLVTFPILLIAGFFVLVWEGGFI
jgi:PE family